MCEGLSASQLHFTQDTWQALEIPAVGVNDLEEVHQQQAVAADCIL